MKRIISIVFVAVLALPMMAQQFNEQEQPQVVFQSTSVMQGSGSEYIATPTLNIDGTVNSPATPTSNGPRKAAKEEASNPGTPGSNGTQLPVGDGMWLLMGLALAFAGVLAIRRLASRA